ncbi:MgtC family protein [Pseudomonas putida]|nr:putative membrane protein [Pseudomonas putida]TCP80047.1 MgtC family protein [Pseudomonas putida]
MDWKVFLLRVSMALLLGALIGAQRQLRQRLTGLRTNALVSTGACLFVLMTQAVPGMAPADASRVAAYGKRFWVAEDPAGRIAGFACARLAGRTTAGHACQ